MPRYRATSNVQQQSWFRSMLNVKGSVEHDPACPQNLIENSSQVAFSRQPSAHA
jgi:hypothetical protein